MKNVTMPARDTTISKVRRRMARPPVATQQQLADAIGVSQGHLSRVLGGKLPLTGKTRTGLKSWLDGGPPAGDPRSQIHALIDRILDISPAKTGLVLSVLHAFEAER